MKKIILSVLAITAAMVFTSCSSDNEPARGTIDLQLLNLEALEAGYSYEGWLVTPTGVVSTGKFTSVSPSQTFSAVATDIAAATEFVLSIEPPNDTDAGPSTTKILKGTFVGNACSLSINNVVGNYSSASGVYVLATPTDNNANNDENGIWFMNPNTNPASAGLNLPDFTATSGWKYEGWVVVDNVPVSTGKFLSVTGVDEVSPFSGNSNAPAFPGEDFISSVVNIGVTFPIDVRGKQVVISIEPNPDDSEAPFSLKPLVGFAGQSTSPAINSLNLNSASFPAGTVSKL